MLTLIPFYRYDQPMPAAVASMAKYVLQETTKIRFLTRWRDKINSRIVYHRYISTELGQSREPNR